ncbi:unnamed protein product [Peronospora effusa]|uniref:Uncharacterized protein n=1 Tax=Peronospora effusa TaxID=542832 RepID=A0A3M6VFZ9_9STRA|nr:hypothetical protein DD238_003326 [Peronospora effusa]CAI5718316.1 unnamed protein product [Peronospora effusa]
MGAVLVCFGGEAASDYDEMKQQTPNGNSLLDRLQTSWSYRQLDEEDEDPVNWESFMLQSNKSTASSGSRMLSAFYSRLLEENDDCAYYFDTKGQRIKGEYLDQIKLLEHYFLPIGQQGRLLSLHHPVTKALEMDNSNDDCFSMSSTLMSEVDYWISADLPKPVLGRCSSVGPPVHASLKIHRAVTSPHLQEDMYFAHLYSPWSIHSSKLENHQVPSLKSLASAS